MSDLHRFLNLHDFERAAQRKLPRPLWAYLSGAVEDSFDMASPFLEDR